METLEINKPKHAICSASGAERWLSCPGSIKLSQGIESKTSSFAEEGTRAHAHAEQLLRKVMQAGWKLSSDDVRDVEDEMLPEDRESYMMRHILTYVRLCLDEVERFDSAPVVRIEQKLVLDDGMAMFGTADFLATGRVNGKPCGVICDLKYGAGKKVSVENNPQLAYYAVALKKSSALQLEEVKVRIIQPRSVDYTSEVTYTRQELDEWEMKLILGAEKTLWMAAGATPIELNVGRWCQFCPAKSRCPEKKK